VPDGTLGAGSTVVNTPAAGRLLVIFSSTLVEINCSAGNARFGLYADNAPVPDTLRSYGSDGVLGAVTVFGVTASALPAGDHTISVGADCPGGSLGVTGNALDSLGAVLLGQ
jgi:hypothetical protein